MGIFVDPREPVEREIDGVTFLIRVLTGRDKAVFYSAIGPIEAAFREAGERPPDVDEEADEDTKVAQEQALLKHGMRLGEAMLSESIVDSTIAVLRMGIAGWRGEGAPEALLENGRLSMESLDRIAPARWSALYSAIVTANCVSGDDEGNSPAP